jgi:hypothetical protein
MSKDVAVASVRARAPTRARADVEAYRLTLTDHNRRRPSPSRLSRPSSTASRHRHFDSHVRSRPFKVQIARRKQAFRRQRREQLGACCTRRRPLGRASCCGLWRPPASKEDQEAPQATIW